MEHAKEGSAQTSELFRIFRESSVRNTSKISSEDCECQDTGLPLWKQKKSYRIILIRPSVHGGLGFKSQNMVRNSYLVRNHNLKTCPKINRREISQPT